MADLDVIIPVYNEAESIDELVMRLKHSLDRENINYNLIFVDDNSTDNTRQIVNKHVINENSHSNGAQDGDLQFSYKHLNYHSGSRQTNGRYGQNGYPKVSRVKLVGKRGKKGKAYSILEGARAGNAPYVAMIDGDLQYPPEALPELYKIAKTKGVAVAKRRINGISPLRKFGSYANILIFEKFLHGFDCDTQSGLKVFRREILESLSESEVTPWTLDMPLLAAGRDFGYEIGTAEIKFSDRKNGKSKVNFIKTAGEIAKSAVTLKLKNKKIQKFMPKNGNPYVGAGVTYKGKRFITHSHLPYEQSAITTLVAWQKIFLIGLLALLIAGFLINTISTVIVLISVLTITYFLDLVFGFTVLLKSLQNPPEVKIKDKEIKLLQDENLPIYTILCPLYKEEKILPQFISAIGALDWPKDKLDAILLLEEDDYETLEALGKIHLPSYFRLVKVPVSNPRTKPKACNYGFAHARGEYVVIYDAEDIPDPLQMKIAYIAFNKLSKEVVCLQSKLNYYNTNQNLLTRLFTSEYSLWFDLILPGLQSINTTIPLGGTSNHFKAKALRFLHGWDAFNVTEDCDLGTRLFKAGFKTAIIDSTTYEEASSRLVGWIKQRSRWIKGYFQTFLVHMRNPIEFYKQHGFHSFIFSLVIGMRMIFMLINPILWIATATYFIARPFVGTFIESLYPTPIYYIATTSLVFGNFLYFYYFMIGVAKRGNWEIMKYVFLMPFYWLMTSVASLVAVYQLIVKPHFWEKTEHGLVQDKSTSLIPDVNVSLGFDFGFPIKAIRGVVSRASKPVWLLFKNALDFIGLLEPQDSENSVNKEKLRILVLNWRDTKHIWAGGAEKYLHELSKRWVKKGHSVTVFCGWDGNSARDENVEGVNVIRRGGFYTVYLFAFFYYLLKFRGKFDIVVDSENGIPFFTPLFINVPKVLLIHHVHQKVFREHLKRPFSDFAGFLESRAMPYFYKNPSIVTVSNSSKEDIVLRGWGTTENTEIVTPGIDSDLFNQGQKTGHPSFVYLGRLKPYKNIDLLIKAFAKIHSEYPDARLKIAGFGESLNSLKKLVKDLNLGGSVSFLGRVSDTERNILFAESWVAVQPSSIEGWGFTVIEANAAGTPVIASNVKGLRDSVVDGETGFLFPEGNLEKLIKSMEILLSDDFLREQLSQNAYLWSKRFNWASASNKFENVLIREVSVFKPAQSMSEMTEIIRS